MQHDSGLVGDLAVRKGSRVALLLLVEDAVLGQQQVHERSEAQAIELSVLAAVSCRAANSRVFVGFGGAGAATTSQAAARDPREMARRELGGELADCKTLAKTA